MLKTDSLIFQGNIKYFVGTTTCEMVCGENMVSKKSKTVYSVKVSRLEFVSLPITDQLQPIFSKFFIK